MRALTLKLAGIDLLWIDNAKVEATRERRVEECKLAQTALINILATIILDGKWLHFEISGFSSFFSKRNKCLSVVESCATQRKKWTSIWFACTSLSYNFQTESLNDKHFWVYREFISKEVIPLIFKRIFS